MNLPDFLLRELRRATSKRTPPQTIVSWSDLTPFFEISTLVIRDIGNESHVARWQELTRIAPANAIELDERIGRMRAFLEGLSKVRPEELPLSWWKINVLRSWNGVGNLLTGSSLGIILGLSTHAGTASAVLTAILGAVAGLFASGSLSLPVGKPEGQKKSTSLSIWPLAFLTMGLCIGAFAGIYARSNDILAFDTIKSTSGQKVPKHGADMLASPSKPGTSLFSTSPDIVRHFEQLLSLDLRNEKNEDVARSLSFMMYLLAQDHVATLDNGVGAPERRLTIRKLASFFAEISQLRPIEQDSVKELLKRMDLDQEKN